MPLCLNLIFLNVQKQNGDHNTTVIFLKSVVLFCWISLFKKMFSCLLHQMLLEVGMRERNLNSIFFILVIYIYNSILLRVSLTSLIWKNYQKYSYINWFIIFPPNINMDVCRNAFILIWANIKYQLLKNSNTKKKNASMWVSDTGVRSDGSQSQP